MTTKEFKTLRPNTKVTFRFCNNLTGKEEMHTGYTKNTFGECICIEDTTYPGWVYCNHRDVFMA